MHRFALGLAALALVLVTTACEDDPEPKIAEPTEDPTSQTTSDPPTSEPTTEPVRLSPEQTVREWISLRNRALRTGVTDPVRELNADGCQTCEYELEPIDDVYAAGGYFDTPGWTVVAIRRDPNFKSNGELVAALVYEAGETVRAEGEEPIRYGKEKRLAVFQVEKAGSAWLVTKIFYPQ